MSFRHPRTSAGDPERSAPDGARPPAPPPRGATQPGAGPRTAQPGAVQPGRPGIIAQRPGSTSSFVGRAAPPIPKLPSVPQGRPVRPVRGKSVPAPRPGPYYAYMLSDLDDIFSAADARTDREQQRWFDRANRRTAWRVLGFALVVVVIVTVVVAFGLAGVIGAIASVLPSSS